MNPKNALVWAIARSTVVLALGAPADADLGQEADFRPAVWQSGDRFGISADCDGDTLVVGASGESSAATGVNGNPFDNSATQAGAAYVFIRENGLWVQQAYLKASNTEATDFFGSKVAISGDTIVVVAGGEDSLATGVNGDESDNSGFAVGAAYVFVRSGTTWAQEAYLKPSNSESFDSFGGSVAIDGDTIVIGARGEDSSAVGVGGDDSDNGASGSGAAYVFVREDGAWTQQAYLKASNAEASDLFGRSVALDGDLLAVSADGEAGGAVGVDGDQSDDSAFLAGAVYVFRRSGATWSQEAYIKASNTDPFDGFFTVSLSGDTLAVGAYDEDSAATGVDGDQLDNSASVAGAVYVFTHENGVWSQQAYLKASNTEAGDYFNEVELLGDRLLVGAVFEDSSATGVAGDEDDNGTPQSGAVYVFERVAGAWSQVAYVKTTDTFSEMRWPAELAMSTDYFVGTTFWVEPSEAAYAFELCPLAESAEVVRLGSPPNPASFLPGQTSGPVVGATWDPRIDHATFLPGAVLDFVGVGVAATNIPSGFGTILCGLAPPAVATAPPGAPFVVPIPNVCSHVGLALCAQGGSVNAFGTIELTNALDLTLGSH